MRHIFALAIVFAVGICADARACSVPFIRTLDNQTVTGTMAARSGKPCNIYLQRTVGPMFTAQIVARPSHGAASVGAGNRITYVSSTGYVGSDAFTYARGGLDRHNQKVVRTVRISVTVAP